MGSSALRFSFLAVAFSFSASFTLSSTSSWFSCHSRSIARALSGSSERLIRVTLLGDQVHSPVLARTLRELGADYFIASGRVDKLKAQPYGQVTLAVAEGQCDAIVQRLSAAGVLAQALQA